MEIKIQAGSRVRISSLTPFFGSEEQAKSVLETGGRRGFESAQKRFEKTMREIGLKVFSEGTVRNVFSDGWASVDFDGCSTTGVHIPLLLLELLPVNQSAS